MHLPAALSGHSTVGTSESESAMLQGLVESCLAGFDFAPAAQFKEGVRTDGARGPAAFLLRP